MATAGAREALVDAGLTVRDDAVVVHFQLNDSATCGGEVVVKPDGGLLSQAYIHGLNHHYDAVLQLRGAVGNRQVDKAEIGLVTASAGPSGGAILYGVDQAPAPMAHLVGR